MQKVLSSFVFISAFSIYVLFRTQIISTSEHVAVKIPQYVTTIYTDDDSNEPKRYKKIKIKTPGFKNNINTLQITKLQNQTNRHYKDGVYIGPNIDSYYEMVQIKITVKSGVISNISSIPYTQYNGTSKAISDYAMPILKKEVLTIQSANVNTVSGATEISNAFRTSLTGALQKAS